MSAERSVAPPVPGKILRKRLEEQQIDIKQDRLADALGVSRFSINQVLNGRRGISAEMALRLQAVLGTSPQMWLKLQAEHDLFEARAKIGDQLGRLPRLVQLPDGPPV